MKRTSIIFGLCLAGLLFSCNKVDEKVAVFELGTLEDKLILDAADGEFALNVISDGEFTARISSGSEWCRFVADAPAGVLTASGDVLMKLHKDLNRNIMREGEISLERMGKVVRVPIYQKGILSEGITFSGHYLGVDAVGGQAAALMITLFDIESLGIEVSYSGEQTGWISGVKKQNNYLMFEASPNQTAQVRTAEIIVTAPDRSSDRLIVNQKGSVSELQTVTVEQLKALSQGAETVLPGNLLLEGVVISDNLEGNGSFNVNHTPLLQDRERSSRCFYIQNADGTSGLMACFMSAKDNSLRRYDSATILLDGVVLKRESAPERYSLEGLSASSILSATAGNEFDLPANEKYINELTDADIYTLVTLKDCEIPFRKGPFVPVDLRYKSVLNKYAMPVRDINGDGLYLLSNTACAWERDGNGLPEGSGSIKGVIVHEEADNFEWDVDRASSAIAAGVGQDYIHDIGNIGNYQIRPVERKDIALSKDFEDGFSGLLMEVRYYNASFDAIVKNVASNVIYSTYPAVANPISDNSIKGNLRLVSGGKNVSISTWRDWSHLGPLENGLISNPSGGNGVYDYLGNSAHWNVYSLVPQSALIYMDNGSAWASGSWSTSKWWQADISTLGLDASNFPISVQFGASNSLGEGVGAPRYWKLEYSTDGSSYHTVTGYTVPDFPIVYKLKPWQCPGFKMFTFNLPEDSELLGKERVSIRLIPADNRAGTDESYDGGTIVSGQSSALNYFAVRYNK